MEHFDVCIIGSGSGNTIIDERFEGKRVALVERGVFGGTCLNVGCIPTKMFVLPADLARSPEEGGRLGVDLRFEGVRFEEVRDRIFGRIDPISSGGKQWREQQPHVELFTGTARFVGPDSLEIAIQGEDEPYRISADQFVIAAGSRARFKDLPGLNDPRVAGAVHTSDTIMRLPSLPKSMIIHGGGFVAAEFAHVFSSYGTQVTMINRSPRLLRKEDEEVSELFTRLMGERVRLVLNQDISAYEANDDGTVAVIATDANGVEYSFEAEVVLEATGRIPNGDTLNLSAAGVETDQDGFVVVDAHQRTTNERIWALGDVCSHAQLKHVANAEARTVQHNLLHPDDLASTDHRFIPHAVFSDPQVAAVGATEQELREQGRRYVTKVQRFGDVAYGWALEDQEHFCKVIADPATGQLLGAHIVGPQASTLLQPLVQAMSFGLGVREMARGQYWIHPALTEVIENALLGLELDA
ncbi:MAG TPA: mycothione reductase [Candidatus Luteococcus avicola]|nr:mycothione reductase [Candidatus Luteococcus avicola]